MNGALSKYHAYSGTQPYIFISYAHKDSDKVLKVIGELIDRKYRVWYDEGIEVGADWPEVIASHLANAEHVLVFTSAASAASQNCTREINYAIDLKKDMSKIQLDKTEPKGGMGMQLSVVGGVWAGEKSAADICTELEAAGCITEKLVGDGVEGYTSSKRKTKKSFNKWMAAALVFAIMFIAAAVAAFGLTRGWFSAAGIKTNTVDYGDDGQGTSNEYTYTVWNDSISRDLLLSAMNGSSLYICGNAFVSSADAIEYKNGAWSLGDKVLECGEYGDFSAIVKKANLKELALVYQGLDDLSGIEDLSELTYLDISGNDIQSLSPLASLQKLKVLKITHIPCEDLSTLAALPSLQKVYISADMVESVKGLLHESFEIVIKE